MEYTSEISPLSDKVMIIYRNGEVWLPIECNHEDDFPKVEMILAALNKGE